jgi:hypothetical protein
LNIINILCAIDNSKKCVIVILSEVYVKKLIQRKIIRVCERERERERKTIKEIKITKYRTSLSFSLTKN